MTMPGRFISESGFLAGDADRARADAMRISPGYFKTMGMTVLRGRDFDARDAMTSPHVAIVSEALAARLWPAGNALGQSLAWHFPNQKGQPWWLRVIGVVNETTPVLQDIGERPMLYLNLAQTWEHYSLFVVGVDRRDPAGLIQRLRAAIESADHFAEVQQIQSMSQVVAEILYPRRAAVAILLASGLVGLILASIGIYGVISYSVAQRLREIGIRATLGANRRDILSLVLREATMVTLAGAVPGVWLGLVALKVTSNVVGAVPAFDLVTFLVVPILTMAVILAASYVPARRASRLDPMEVLREG
jgi:putative ABC transport system permease protein